MFEEIKQRNTLVRDQIYKGFVGGEQLLEKAHQVGDVHPNGKYVWTEYAPGKFDWRGIKKNVQEKKTTYGDIRVEAEEFLDNALYSYAISYAEQSDEISDLMDKLKTEQYTHPAIEEAIVNYMVNEQGEEFSSQIKKLCDKYGKDKVRDLLIKENPGDADIPKKTMSKIIIGLITKYGK